MATTLQRQETLEELADFKRLDLHAEGRSDHLLHTHLANLPPSNSENPKVNHRSMDNTSFLTGKETSCVQKGDHNSFGGVHQKSGHLVLDGKLFFLRHCGSCKCAFKGCDKVDDVGIDGVEIGASVYDFELRGCERGW